MAIKYPSADICISKRFRGDPKGSRFKCAAPRQRVLDPPLDPCTYSNDRKAFSYLFVYQEFTFQIKK